MAPMKKQARSSTIRCTHLPEWSMLTRPLNEVLRRDGAALGRLRALSLRSNPSLPCRTNAAFDFLSWRPSFLYLVFPLWSCGFGGARQRGELVTVSTFQIYPLHGYRFATESEQKSASTIGLAT
ncbi:unnamed protein product [Toxocara canis]|uniref:Uncharacterized protein n=1 Tax=Toxocara canis TaxID=6265 RepID=A0A183V213_TOXCA|nr:unnamed protein product [Toxocara canis]